MPSAARDALDGLIIANLFTPVDTLVDQDDAEAMDAAWECAHGRLPHDRSEPCGCWAQEITKTNPTEVHTNGNHRDQLARFKDQADRVPEDRAADDQPVPA